MKGIDCRTGINPAHRIGIGPKHFDQFALLNSWSGTNSTNCIYESCATLENCGPYEARQSGYRDNSMKWMLPKKSPEVLQTPQCCYCTNAAQPAKRKRDVQIVIRPPRMM